MSVFSGILRYEFLMQIRRKALWIALIVPYILMTVPDILNTKRDYQSAGSALMFFAMPLQIFVPIVAGFFLSDRLRRDEQLGTGDWVSVNGATEKQYIWGKYLGVVSATLLVAFIYWLVGVLLEFGAGVISFETVAYAMIAFIIMVIPSYFFIGAYCIAVPSVMSLRLYQILFSCYWLWAHQQRVPSVAGTPLMPGGEFAMQAFLSGLGAADPRQTINGPFGWTFEITPAMAALNIGLLLLLAAMALIALEKYLVWKQERN